MSAVNRETIEHLIEQTADTNISIFIPTHVKGEEGKQDPIRLKNILQKVKKELSEEGWKDSRIEELFKPTYSLIEENQFWLHQDKGLAIYLNEGYFDYFQIPVTPNEDYAIAENFHITPLLALQNHHGVYHILAISQGGTRLLKATPDELTEVPIESVPVTMEEHLKYFEHVESIQQHSGSGGGQAIYHGQGGDKGSSNKELKLFLKHIENKVTKYLKKVNGPLVLAGTDKTVSYYREANNYNLVMKDHISGNVDNKSGKELNEEAWSIVEPYFLEELESDIERYNNLNGSDLISSNLGDIVKSSYFGQVDTLFVPMNHKQWGKFIEKENRVDLSESKNGETVELINFAAISALRNGSTLYGLEPDEMPDTASLAAIYRYKT